MFLSGKHVDKAKVVAGNLEGRSRWTPRGFDDRTLTWKECESPTLSDLASGLIDCVGSSMRWQKLTFDWRSAFFKSTPLPVSDVIYIEVPPEEQHGTEKLYRRMLVAVPGTKNAPRRWYETASGELKEHGWERSFLDPCLFLVA